MHLKIYKNFHVHETGRIAIEIDSEIKIYCTHLIILNQRKIFMLHYLYCITLYPDLYFNICQKYAIGPRSFITGTSRAFIWISHWNRATDTIEKSFGRSAGCRSQVSSTENLDFFSQKVTVSFKGVVECDTFRVPIVFREEQHRRVFQVGF